MKRPISILILFLCGMLILSASYAFIPGDETLAHAAAPVTFKDVASGYWGRPFINFASETGIIKGYADSGGGFRFKPENSVTCEEAMQMIMQSVKNSGIGPVPDVPLPRIYEQHLIDYKISGWAYDCVSYGLEYDILEMEELAGFRTASGAPANATREQVARWAAKALHSRYPSEHALTFAAGEPYMPATSLTFLDKDRIDPENMSYIDLLQRMSIMIGDSSNRFNPKDGIKRVEFAVICTRIYDLAAKPYGSERESASYAGTITGVNSAKNKIYLSMSDGSARVIDLADKVEIVYNGLAAYNGLEEIETGKDAVIAYGPFGQVHVATEVFLGRGRVQELVPVCDSYSTIAIRMGDGTVVYYFMNGETSILNEPETGQDVLFISDGVKILEIQQR